MTRILIIGGYGNFGRFTTAQKTTRGVATTAAILSYTGKPFTALQEGKPCHVYGWQNLHGRRYSGLGWRLLGNCNIPDLDIFPQRYPTLKTLRFSAGIEISFILVAQKLAEGKLPSAGATACVGIITKDEYLTALEALDIRWTVS